MKLSIALALLWAIPAAAQWTYGEQRDEMSGKSERHAYVPSFNSLSLSFPYAGTNMGQLLVRKHPRYGLGVIFSIDKGQIICRSYGDGCFVKVKYDDGPVHHFSASPPDDGSSTHIFLNDPARFIAGARKAKEIRVQATYYQGGSPALLFKTPGPLEWK